MECDVSAARSFVYGNARLLEQRLYSCLFEESDPEAVVRAVVAYRNLDGGFGNGLEPDKRDPASHPLDVEIALERLVISGASAGNLARSACDWLDDVAEPSGAVAVVLPTIAHFPHAPHWHAAHPPPGLNPTAGIIAHMHTLGVSHPWVDRATEYCFSALESGNIADEAHTLLGAAKFLAAAPDRRRSGKLVPKLRYAIPHARFLRFDPASEAYGLTPLDFAPTPDALPHSWFDPLLIDAHLNALESEQMEDGGWPIAWDTLSGATLYEWRAIKTVLALRTLAAYGRVPSPDHRWTDV